MVNAQELKAKVVAISRELNDAIDDAADGNDVFSDSWEAAQQQLGELLGSLHDLFRRNRG